MKISFSRTHGTGKTTSVFELAHKMKIEYPGKKIITFVDDIRNSPFGFNKGKPVESQLWMFASRIKNELELSSKFDIVICDRTVFDIIAYTKYFGFNYLASDMFDLAINFAPTYDKIILKTIKNNDYLIEEGVDRDTKDHEYRQKVEDELRKIYHKLRLYSSSKFEYEEI